MSEPDLDNLDYARFAWGRYRRIMGWMTAAAVMAALFGLSVLRLAVGPMPLVATAFAAGGIFFTVLLAAALMGLVFLSSGSGHDDKILDPTWSGDE